MNRCPNCAAQNREGAKFCTSCGFRLPTDGVPPTVSDRSPFATTSTVPPFVEQTPAPPKSPESSEESGFAAWNTEPPPQPSSGSSWDSAPPPSTSMPVDDQMIASLVGDSGPPSPSDQPDPLRGESPEATALSDRPSWETAAPPPRRSGEMPPSVDQLLRLARDLEYGLMELADGVQANLENIDSRLLDNVLADLRDEEELAPLRHAVATAQERPRDVDVMLDLVLRADAIAAVLTERDQLKSAISLVLANAGDSSAESDDESTDGEQPSGDAGTPLSDDSGERSGDDDQADDIVSDDGRSF